MGQGMVQDEVAACGLGVVEWLYHAQCVVKLLEPVPFAQADKFPELFAAMDNEKDDLGIEAYGTSVTNLEEVFLKAGMRATLNAIGYPLHADQIIDLKFCAGNVGCGQCVEEVKVGTVVESEDAWGGSKDNGFVRTYS
eukprot:5100946-Amphidinium_carterae.1